MQWTHQGSPPPKKFKVQKSAGKIMATVFWDIEGILLIEYMPHKTTITGASYAFQQLNLCVKPFSRNGGGSSLVEFSFCKTTQAHTHLVLQRLLLKKRASDNLTTHPTV